MVALLPVLLSILFVGLVVESRGRRVRPAEPALNTNPKTTRRIEAAVRRGKIGTRVLSEQLRSSAAIAPLEDPNTVLQLFNLDGSPLKKLATADVAMIRGWSNGHVAAAHGENRREYGVAWPLNPTATGWEIKIVTAAGAVYHCAGEASPTIERDLARLHQRVNDTVLAHAS